MRFGILVSGRGSNMRAILEAISDGTLPAVAALVLSNNPEAPALGVAQEHGVPTHTVDHRDFRKNRAAFEREIDVALRSHSVDLVVLAGFMRLLSADFVRKWPEKIINIHPSLLPDFPGLHAPRQALKAGAETSGCTVHYVDEGMDTGAIIAQAEVPVLANDTEETLAARILGEEHRLLTTTLRQLCEAGAKSTNSGAPGGQRA
jgi:phosphoribosylglycinamide formyltransferase-1